MRVKTLLRLSIAVAAAAIALKAGAWWLTGSVGLLSDAVESLVNLAAAVFALSMVTIAERPADAGHPFGHGKAEYFSSAFEGVLIAAAAAAIVWTAAPRLMHPQPLAALGVGLGLTVVASALNGLLAWKMFAVARTERSIALEADAQHLLADVWTSAGIVAALVVAHLTGWLWLDPLVAIAVALHIVREGARLVWRSVDGLMDSAVEPAAQGEIERILARHAADGAIRFDHLVTRRAGRARFVDVHLHVPGGWTLARAAALRGEVERELVRGVPGLRASIQLLPANVEAYAPPTLAAKEPEAP